MNKLLIISLLSFLICTSCEKDEGDVFLKVGENIEFSFSDIALYDTSTHIVYFKKEYDELEDLEDGTFAILENGKPVLTGILLPGYSSLGPSGPYIMTPPMYGEYSLRIGAMNFGKSDPRRVPELFRLLKDHNLLHSGLLITDCSIENKDEELIFTFTVSNKDADDLLIIDIDKTGPNLFHYFTNGLYIRDPDYKEVFSGTIEHERPEPWNGWKKDWLSELQAGQSKQFIISYPVKNKLNAGEYSFYFNFPGLAYQVSFDQLYQGKTRIWLGDVSYSGRIIVK